MVCAISVFYVLFLFLVRYDITENFTLQEFYLTVKENYDIFYDTNEFHADFFLGNFSLVLLVLAILQIILNDFKIAKAYVFVRLTDVIIWYKYKILQTVVVCFFSSFVYNIAIVLLGCFVGCRCDKISLLFFYVILGIVLMFIVLLVFSLLGFVISFLLKEHYVTTVIVILMTSLILITHFSTVENVQYNILINTLVSWHVFDYVCEPVHTFSGWIYFLFSMVIIAVELVIGYKLLKKVDHI